MSVTYVNALIFTGDRILNDYAVVTENDMITAVIPQSEVKDTDEQIDLEGGFLAPAFIDLQIYGGNGEVFSLYPSVKALAATYEYSRAGGAAHIMPTVATHSPEIMLAAMEAVRAYWQEGRKGVLGLHLEGPFINPAKKGAHLPKYIRTPTQEDIDWILANGKDVVKIITLAPECCDPALVKQLQEAGITVFAGHSNATYAQAYTSFENGIRHATHLFNAMSPLESRAPGLVGAIYNHPGVFASIVADGIHVDFAAVSISHKIMDGRLFLITDAIEENLEGDYIYIKEKDRFVGASGVLSGSRLTMLQAVHNCTEKAGIHLHEALKMASLYPARAMRLDSSLGRIEPGFKAAFIVLRDHWKMSVYC
ncbi:N-acetylglucosamine-6-phosphate deacetylase [Chitinophaga sp. Mgbs1]|uniref:N-acetylglucosamine-6-phosphate deacetylase n=1 Tax=Chitinophaga solisilvae TaxID=1233460 RepID=A0A3S1AY70_9BACT|nr:N-acetylglucosamine-6-phosphate deacetylase [Chitinophaga solisilvae]